MGERPPDQNQASWHPEGEQVEKPFVVLPPPEVMEGWQENKRQTDNGQPLRHEILNEKGQQVYIHETGYQTGPDASPETRKSDWQRFADAYDDQGRVLKERTQKLFPAEIQNTSSFEHQYDDRAGTHTTTGRIEGGLDMGHSWRTTRGIVKDFGDGRVIKLESTEVLEQGQNPSKPEKGAKFTKIMYFEGGTWLGEEVEHPDGQKTQQFAKGIEKLPEWV